MSNNPRLLTDNEITTKINKLEENNILLESKVNNFLNTKEKILFISNETYIVGNSLNYIKNLSHVEYHKYNNSEETKKLIENSEIKRVLLFISSTQMIDSGIPDSYPDKVFLAPYSTLTSLRSSKYNKNNNISFVMGTDEYLIKSVTDQIFNKSGLIILEKPSETNNKIIREEINRIVNENNDKRPSSLQFDIAYLDELQSLSSTDKDKFKKRFADSRRVYYFGSIGTENELFSLFKKNYDSKLPFVALIFINYVGIDMEQFKSFESKFKGFGLTGIVYAGTSRYGNKHLKNGDSNVSQLAKYLREEGVESMTPAMSFIPTALDIDWNKLEQDGLMYKRYDTNFCTFFTIFY